MVLSPELTLLIALSEEYSSDTITVLTPHYCSTCMALLQPDDGHNLCPSCIGLEHLREGLSDNPSCLQHVGCYTGRGGTIDQGKGAPFIRPGGALICQAGSDVVSDLNPLALKQRMQRHPASASLFHDVEEEGASHISGLGSHSSDEGWGPAL
ncbi:uncharacterized protein AKAME5_002622700 [Lates japonicus]|uniref:Uncharacterized protein n=1 Tax=Lates japonicus TaxID=270547 RepID=A0AAD3RML7_LATJO|nr:uncharacterized protein AKAME5_002541400 [Lates japonicus]GLD74895.1 uncharacterized protein AKAME5_002622700 [Lates japonicus]